MLIWISILLFYCLHSRQKNRLFVINQDCYCCIHVKNWDKSYRFLLVFFKVMDILGYIGMLIRSFNEKKWKLLQWMFFIWLLFKFEATSSRLVHDFIFGKLSFIICFVWRYCFCWKYIYIYWYEWFKHLYNMYLSTGHLHIKFKILVPRHASILKIFL